MPSQGCRIGLRGVGFTDRRVLYIGDVVMATITKKQMEEYERLRRDRDNGRLLTPDGLRLICAAYENDPEKIGIHMLEMLAKFRNEGIID